jgi:DNA modification methylase
MKLYNDDCMNIFPLLKDNEVHLTLTDIPYEVVNRTSKGIRKFNKDKADIGTFILSDFIDEVVRITSGSIYIFCSTEQCSFIRERMIKHGLSTRHCIWEKNNPSPVNGQHLWLSSIENCIFGKKRGAIFNEHCQSPVWRHPIERNINHPTPKPLKLMERLVMASSTEGDVVFDPCMGSGVVGVVSKQNNRDFVGIELDKKYFKYANKRINKERTIYEVVESK